MILIKKYTAQQFGPCSLEMFQAHNTKFIEKAEKYDDEFFNLIKNMDNLISSLSDNESDNESDNNKKTFEQNIIQFLNTYMHNFLKIHNVKIKELSIDKYFINDFFTQEKGEQIKLIFKLFYDIILKIPIISFQSKAIKNSIKFYHETQKENDSKFEDQIEENDLIFSNDGISGQEEKLANFLLYSLNEFLNSDKLNNDFISSRHLTKKERKINHKKIKNSNAMDSRVYDQQRTMKYARVYMAINIAKDIANMALYVIKGVIVPVIFGILLIR